MFKSSSTAILALAICLPSCRVGESREFDPRRDLSGLDVAYMRSRVQENHGANQQSVEGELTGWPFWFLPATMRLRGSNSLHLGEVAGNDDPMESAYSPISGFEYANTYALGFGLLYYAQDQAEWDDTGGLQEWRESNGLGWGLLYNDEHWGQGERRTGMRTELLAGMLGYLEEGERGYLKLLWIPIPL